MITWSSIPVELRMACVAPATIARALKSDCGNIAFKVITRSWIQPKLAGPRDPVDAGIEERRRVTGPKIGIRYSKLKTPEVSPPGKIVVISRNLHL